MSAAAPHWRFRVMSPSEINENPVQGEFFTANLPERFVREAVQNSLDAKAGEAPVRVRFVISGADRALSPERAAPYLNGLRPHYQAVVDAERGAGNSKRAPSLAERKALFDTRMPFLVVEDFGTTGLRGDVRTNEPQAEGNDFWGLFRSVGISPKGKDASGSWGLGKWVFPDASKLNAFIGVTRRQDDDELLIMGQAMLKLHKLGDQKYAHYGYFAAASSESEDKWLPMPASSNGRQAPFLKRAVADFGLQDRNQAGTSVVVPHPEDELADPNKLAWAAITQYFWPILAGDLVVEIVSSGGPTRTIDADTIGGEVHRCGEASAKEGEEAAGPMARAIELAAWGMASPPEEHAEADARRSRNVEAIAPNELPRLRERFARGERLAFTARTKVDRTLSPFHVFVEKDATLSKGHDYHVRGHLHVPNMDYIQGFQARALTHVASRSPLGHLLRDSEGPAHDRWNPSAHRLKEKGWPAAAVRVREAQRAAERILEKLAAKPEHKQRDALADLFPSKPTGRGGTAAGGGASDWMPPDPGDPKPLPRVLHRRGGFAVTTDHHDGLVGTTWIVRMAYDVARGTARTAFSRFASGLKAGCPDFTLLGGRLSVQHDGCSVEVLSANELQVAATEPAISLLVTGFDDRDLLVDVSQVMPQSDLDAYDSEDETHLP